MPNGALIVNIVYRRILMLIFTALLANSEDNNLMIFSQKTRFDISCKLSPKERKIFQNVVC